MASLIFIPASLLACPFLLSIYAKLVQHTSTIKINPTASTLPNAFNLLPAETLTPPAPLFSLFFSLFSYFLKWLIQQPESLCGVCGNRTQPCYRRRGKWPERARRFLLKMVDPGRMVAPGTGSIQKTTRRFQVRLPFLPQAKRRGRVKPLFVCWTNSE